MCSNRIAAFASAILLCLTLLVFPAAARPSAAQTQDGVYEGTTSVYRTDSTLPANQGLTLASDPSAHKKYQKQKADQLAAQDKFGFSLTIMSMAIVVLALAVLSTLFLIFGRVSSSLQRRRKVKAQGPAPGSHSSVQEEDSGEVIAAISAAIAEHFSGKHDMEDYILTIRSMKRSYSPWNSKIYNLRVLPQINHH